MEISKICKKLSFRCSYSNPNSFHSLFSTCQSLLFNASSKTLISPLHPPPSFFPHVTTKYHTFHSFQPFSSLTSPSSSYKEADAYTYCRNCSRSYSTDDSIQKGDTHHHSKPKVDWEKIREIVQAIGREQDDMETKLNQMNVSISFELTLQIFRNLNSQALSGLRFFLWLREKKLGFNRNSEFCSLVIDNLGRIQDYASMLLLFKDFSKEKLCLTEKAFDFVEGFDRDSLQRVVKMLNEVGGGSCYNSGIHSLIKMLCILNRFDLAKFVMEETERKTSYYNLLIWAKCGSVDFQQARCLLDEMRGFGCQPDANSYSYLLGSFCKSGRIVDGCRLLEEMDDSGFPVDAITFEMVINRACRLGRLDFAVEFLNQMTSRGIEPRYTTHAAVIKGYFYCNRFQDAYKYVVGMGEKYKGSANVNYSLLATLLHRSRRVIEAREILVAMMEKGIKPHFPIYVKVLKDLYKSGRGRLVADLKTITGTVYWLKAKDWTGKYCTGQNGE